MGFERDLILHVEYRRVGKGVDAVDFVFLHRNDLAPAHGDQVGPNRRMRGEGDSASASSPCRLRLRRVTYAVFFFSLLILQQPGEPLSRPHFLHFTAFGLQHLSEPLICPQ